MEGIRSMRNLPLGEAPVPQNLDEVTKPEMNAPDQGFPPAAIQTPVPLFIRLMDKSEGEEGKKKGKEKTKTREEGGDGKKRGQNNSTWKRRARVGPTLKAGRGGRGGRTDGGERGGKLMDEGKKVEGVEEEGGKGKKELTVGKEGGSEGGTDRSLRGKKRGVGEMVDEEGEEMSRKCSRVSQEVDLVLTAEAAEQPRRSQ
ncbi:uncharacterized protein LOC131007995 [Salvia miltiorrhiza]|uniref:uncharacterized protein LOC131007995 n=1 Tax=Salvia miltiorrhiza TaxID=226208 RepID=UPI0025AC082A|nr:uncharacterized protein LOC131007995 [Salvia miltiorrhiza]